MICGTATATTCCLLVMGTIWLVHVCSFACPHVQREREALQWAAYEKQQKEIAKQQEIIQRLSGGAQSGRASQVGSAGGRGGAGGGDIRLACLMALLVGGMECRRHSG
jgi:hypothetical protein